MGKIELKNMCIEVEKCCFCVDLETATRAIALMEAVLAVPCVIQANYKRSELESIYHVLFLRIYQFRTYVSFTLGIYAV